MPPSSSSGGEARRVVGTFADRDPDAWLIWVAAAAGAGALLFLLPPAALNVWWKGAMAAVLGAVMALACLGHWLRGTRKEVGHDREKPQS